MVFGNQKRNFSGGKIFFTSFQPGHEVCWFPFSRLKKKLVKSKHTQTRFHRDYHTHTQTHRTLGKLAQNTHTHTDKMDTVFDYFKKQKNGRLRERRYRPEWHPSMALKIFYPQVASQISVRCWDYRPCCHSSAVEEPWRCCRSSSSSWRFFCSFFLSLERMGSELFEWIQFN